MALTLTLQPDAAAGQDAHIVSSAATLNCGATAELYSGESNVAVGGYNLLIKFDLSTLPAAALISAATLSLFCTADYATNARTWRVFRVKRAWIESEVTWNVWKTGSDWSTAGCLHGDDCEATDIGTRDFTATETVNAWKDFVLTPTTKAGLDLGNGWLIKVDTWANDAYEFSSSDHATAAQRPKLVIVYTLPVPPAAMHQFRQRRM